MPQLQRERGAASSKQQVCLQSMLYQCLQAVLFEDWQVKDCIQTLQTYSLALQHNFLL